MDVVAGEVEEEGRVRMRLDPAVRFVDPRIAEEFSETAE
jgi:hypothetical protein